MGGAAIDKGSVGVAPRFKTTLEERVGERARSRLFEMCRVIRMPNANDYRIRPHRSAQ
jgi:DNA replication protein DnaC